MRKANDVYTPVRKVTGRPGCYFNTYGYVLIHVKRGRFELEHRRIVEQILGRKLKPEEEVNHVNGVKHDNRNANLFVCTKEYHQAWHQRCLRRFGTWHPPVYADPRALSVAAFKAGEPITEQHAYVLAERKMGVSHAPRKLTSSTIASIVREAIGLY